MNELFSELSRRNVFRMAILYIVSSWLILQMGDVLFNLIGVPEWSLRIVFGLLVLGFPIALIFSWLYELTPEGLKLERDVDRGKSITAETGQKLNALTLVVASVAIGLMIYDQAMGPDRALPVPQSAAGNASETNRQRSIAVLPFRDMSASGDQAYFGEGIAEELLNALAQVKGLRVASRTSSFSFKQQESADLETIANRLEVSHLLEGSVRTSGDRIRITAQLIDVKNDAHLWSQSFDRTLDDIFAVQDDITSKVVEELKPHLDLSAMSGAMAKRPAEDKPRGLSTRNPEAYLSFLRGRYEWRKQSGSSLAAATAALEKALELDPTFSEAAELLGRVQVELCKSQPDHASCRSEVVAG